MRSVKAAPALVGLLLCAAVLTTGLTAAAQPPGRSDGKQKSSSRFWWHDEATKAKIGLTADQVTQVEKIFQSSLPNIVTLREEFERLEKQVSKTIADSRATETQLSQEIDLLEAARSRLAKARTIMLVRMRKVLTDEQRTKLDEVHKHSLLRDSNQRRRDR